MHTTEPIRSKLRTQIFAALQRQESTAVVAHDGRASAKLARLIGPGVRLTAVSKAVRRMADMGWLEVEKQPGGSGYVRIGLKEMPRVFDDVVLAEMEKRTKKRRLQPSLPPQPLETRVLRELTERGGATNTLDLITSVSCTSSELVSALHQLTRGGYVWIDDEFTTVRLVARDGDGGIATRCAAALAEVATALANLSSLVTAARTAIAEAQR